MQTMTYNQPGKTQIKYKNVKCKEYVAENQKFTKKRRVLSIQSNEYWTSHVSSDVLSQ